MGLRAGLGVLDKRKTARPSQEWNPEPSSPQSGQAAINIQVRFLVLGDHGIATQHSCSERDSNSQLQRRRHARFKPH